MKKEIVIIGSTGSIGKNTLDVIEADMNKFNILLLSTFKNINLIYSQAKKFKVKNIIIVDKKKYLLAKKKFKNDNIIIHNSFNILDNFFKKKVFYTMISVIGLAGLNPTLKLIKASKNIGIVNKESLICGWSLIYKELKKYNTSFVPIDSEHFSIHHLINKNNDNNFNIRKIFITASGGPFLNYKKQDFKNIQVKDALNHPNWKMGKKISIDSATMMNKVFEVIEAKNIFNLSYKQIEILIHPNSYIHSVVNFSNGIIKLLAHEPSMKIPIHNSIYNNQFKELITKKTNFKILNDLKLTKINKKQYPLVRILDYLPKYNSLYETALVTINDFFVNKFIDGHINFKKLNESIYKYALKDEILNFRKKKVKEISDIFSTCDMIVSKLKENN